MFLTLFTKSLLNNLNSKIVIILLLLLLSTYQEIHSQQDSTKPVQYRRVIELQEGYQSYEEKYAGKNLNEEKRSLFPLESTGVWTELSPRIPRVTYFGVHFINPDLPTGQAGTGWAAGNLGAVIKTTDGGNSWTVSETNTTTLLLKIHSYDGQIVIATGYNGLILRSTDGGETFVQIPSGVGNGYDLWGLQMLNDTVGFVCGLNQTLLKTTDAGLTWQSVNAGLNAHYWALDFYDKNYGMLACDGGKVLRTTDGGDSWTQVQAGDTSDLYAIDIIDSLHIAAAGYLGKTVYSSDGGLSWTQNAAIQHNELNSIRFINPDTGYTIGTYQGESWGIRKTTNKGQNWFSPPIVNLSEWELELLADGLGYSVGSDLWIAKTTGGYDNWAGLFLNANFVDVYFTDELTGYAADGRYIGGPVYKTTDGGYKWYGLPNFPRNVFTSTLRCVTFTDSITGFAGSAPCRIVKTTDAGDSWYVVNRTGLTDTIGLINRIYFINKTTGWAVTTRGGILKTTDSGENWFAQLNIGASNIFETIFFIDSLNGWATSTYIWQTTNSGTNWIQRTDIPAFFSDDIYFMDNVGFIIDFLRLYKTTDSGNNWFLQLNSQYVIRTFGWLSFSHGFIVGDGVYETKDSGNTWVEILELRNVGLRKLHSPKNYVGYTVGFTGLVYGYVDTTIVPVELNIFTANVDGNKVILNWSTSSELNNKGFEIECSTNKTEWRIIGFIGGNGTTTEMQSYSFVDKEELSGTYQYRLKQIDYDGSFEYSKIIEVEVGTPSEFFLSQNYPNPFNPNTVISYQLPVTGFVSFKVYDVLGNEIETLVNEEKPAGIYEITWYPEGLPSGVYFYTIQSNNFVQTRKMMLLK